MSIQQKRRKEIKRAVGADVPMSTLVYILLVKVWKMALSFHKELKAFKYCVLNWYVHIKMPKKGKKNHFVIYKMLLYLWPLKSSACLKHNVLCFQMMHSLSNTLEKSPPELLFTRVLFYVFGAHIWTHIHTYEEFRITS